MASFKSIIGGFVKGLQVAEHIAAPLAKIALPQFSSQIDKATGYVAKLDNIFVRVPQDIITMEAITDKDGQGAVKESNVIASFEAGLVDMKAGLALVGKDLKYDEAELKAAIADFTSGYNHLAKVRASFSTPDLPK